MQWFIILCDTYGAAQSALHRNNEVLMYQLS